MCRTWKLANVGQRDRVGVWAFPSILLAWTALVLTGCGASSASPKSPFDTLKPFVGDDQGGRLAPAIANPIVLQAPSPFRFRDAASDLGIDFVHVSGMTADKHFPTANGSGVAVFDYDGDGRLDLYFATNRLIPPGSPPSGPNRLYRNQGDGSFRDVTEESGLTFAGFCHGILIGDVNNDGHSDVFLANYGPNALFLNNGDGTFRDISDVAGIARPGWSSSGAFLDHDNDGDLDLYVSNYGDWKYPEDDIFCTHDRTILYPGEEKVRTYCSPLEIRTARHFFYRNDGVEGGIPRFSEVAETIGLGRVDGHGFGVVTADIDGDDLIDIYVANDMTPNFFYVNNGDGTFRDASESAGSAFDYKGLVQAGMGVAAEDLDGDGRPELFVTNFHQEYNTVYRNLGGGQFTDDTYSFKFANDSTLWVGWGCALQDFDNDGWLDCFVANGHVDDNRHLLGQEVTHAQPPLLHRNREGLRFELATRDAGAYFDTMHVGRGVAYGDINDDGRMDLVVNHKDGPPAVLINESPTSNTWIRLELVGTQSNRDAIGAKLKVYVGDRVLHRQRVGGSSLESSHDPRILIGLGSVRKADKVVVRWPSGATSILEDLATGQTYRIVEPESLTASSTP